MRTTRIVVKCYHMFLHEVPTINGRVKGVSIHAIIHWQSSLTNRIISHTPYFFVVAVIAHPCFALR